MDPKGEVCQAEKGGLHREVLLTERSCESLDKEEDSLDSRVRDAAAKVVTEAKAWTWRVGRLERQMEKRLFFRWPQRCFDNPFNVSAGRDEAISQALL